MKIIYILVGILSLSSCSHLITADQYSHDEMSNSEFSRESAQCEMTAHQSKNNGGYLAGTAYGKASSDKSYNQVFDACMRSKGFVRKTN